MNKCEEKKVVSRIPCFIFNPFFHVGEDWTCMEMDIDEKTADFKRTTLKNLKREMEAKRGFPDDTWELTQEEVLTV